LLLRVRRQTCWWWLAACIHVHKRARQGEAHRTHSPAAVCAVAAPATATAPHEQAAAGACD
jgi:hypothetical protein